MPHGTTMKPGDRVTIAKKSGWFVGHEGVVRGYHRQAGFGGVTVQWYSVELVEMGMSFNFPEPWLDKEARTCPMTLG